MLSAAPVPLEGQAFFPNINLGIRRPLYGVTGFMTPLPRDCHWPGPIDEDGIFRLWAGIGLKPAVIAAYARVVRVYGAYCSRHRLDPLLALTAVDADRCWRWYSRLRGLPDGTSYHFYFVPALHGFSWALSGQGFTVPTWAPPATGPLGPPIVEEYLAKIREQRGRAERGLVMDRIVLRKFMIHLKKRGVDWHRLAIVDIDDFLLQSRRHFAVPTVTRMASTVRGFLRFLFATGRLKHEFAPSVLAPIRQPEDRPPQALPWTDIRKILGAIDPSQKIGRRDRAQFLLMSAYGLGAAEVLHLQLSDIDWAGHRLRIVRRKTKATIWLPLLSGVARALANYIRSARPRPSRSPYVFLSQRMPFYPQTMAGVLWHRLRYLAAKAGVTAPKLGTHVFRHSHASRQTELGASTKTLADILGHADPRTTSIYIRSAVRRLRCLALPVPT